MYFQPWTLGGLLPAWSLAVEISFYAALPLLVLLMERPFMGRTRAAKIRSELILVAVLFAGALLFGCCVRSNEGRCPDSNLYFTLAGNFDWFALGMFLAIASVWVAGTERAPAPVRLVERHRSLAWLVAAVLFWAIATQMGIGPEFPQAYTSEEWLYEHLFYGAIAFFLLLPAVFGDSLGGLPRVILRNRVLAWLGPDLVRDLPVAPPDRRRAVEARLGRLALRRDDAGHVRDRHRLRRGQLLRHGAAAAALQGPLTEAGEAGIAG